MRPSARKPLSSRDAAHNLSADVQIVNQRVERWTPVRCDAAIADPARRGLGKDGAAAIGATGATRHRWPGAYERGWWFLYSSTSRARLTWV